MDTINMPNDPLDQFFGSSQPQPTPQGQAAPQEAQPQGQPTVGSNPELDRFFGSSQPQQAPDQTGMQKTLASLQALKDGDHATRFQAINDGNNSLAASTMAFIDIFNKQMSSFPQGVMQGLGGNNATLGPSVAQQHDDLAANALIAERDHPTAAMWANGAGFIGNAINTLALGEEIAGATGAGFTGSGLLSKMGNSAASGAFFGGTQYVDPGQSRLLNTGLGAVVGGLAPIASAGYKTAVNDILKPLAEVGSKMDDPAKVALEDVVTKMKNAGVNPQEYLDATKAANAVGMPLSLGEATGKDALTKLDAKAIVNSPEAEALYQNHMNKIEGLKTQSKDLINNLVPEGSPQQVGQTLENGYKDLQNYNVSPENMAKLQQLPGFNEELEAINKGATSELQALPDTNVGKLEEINKNINLMTNKQSGPATGDASLARNSDTDRLLAIKDNLKDVLASSTPDGKYQQVLDLAQRNAQRNSLLYDISTLNNTAGNPTKQFYEKLFGNDIKTSNFLRMVDRSGGNTEAAKNLIDTLQKVVSTPVKLMVKGTRVAGETGAHELEAQSFLKQTIQSITDKDYQAELTKLSLGGAPAQEKILAALTDAPDATKITVLHGILDSMKKFGSDVHGLLPQAVKDAPEAIQAAQVPSKVVINHMTKNSEPYIGMAQGLGDMVGIGETPTEEAR